MVKTSEEEYGNFIERAECNSGYVSVKVDATPITNFSNYTLICNKLIIFVLVCQQLTEVLAEHEVC